MFVQENFYQSKPVVMIEIMNQFSLKGFWNEWGDKAHSAANSEMKQMHLRNNCTMLLLDAVKSMYDGTEGTLDVIMIS